MQFFWSLLSYFYIPFFGVYSRKSSKSAAFKAWQRAPGPRGRLRGRAGAAGAPGGCPAALGGADPPLGLPWDSNNTSSLLFVFVIDNLISVVIAVKDVLAYVVVIIFGPPRISPCAHRAFYKLGSFVVF